MKLFLGIAISILLGYLTLFVSPMNEIHILYSIFWFNILMYVDLMNKKNK
jgi:hypothetical protein